MQDYFAMEKQHLKTWRDLVSSFAVLFGVASFYPSLVNFEGICMSSIINLTPKNKVKRTYSTKTNCSRLTVWFTLLCKGRIDCKSEEAVLNDTKFQKRSRAGLLCNGNATLKDRRDLNSQSWSWQMILLWHTKWKRNLPINQRGCIDPARPHACPTSAFSMRRHNFPLSRSCNWKVMWGYMGFPGSFACICWIVSWPFFL